MTHLITDNFKARDASASKNFLIREKIVTNVQLNLSMTIERTATVPSPLKI